MFIDILHSAASLTDDELLTKLKALASKEREATAHVIAVLVEVDTRRLYLGQGCSSLFTYCTQVLRLSEHAAYGRIEAARAARKFPAILDLLADGSVNLTTVCLLGPHLTNDNHRAVLVEARHRSKREVEEIVARLRPQPPVTAIVRNVPTPRRPTGVADMPLMIDSRDRGSNHEDVAPVTAPVRQLRPEVKPLAPEYYKVQFTASRDTYDKLRLAQDLLRHRIPTGDVAAVVDRALTVLIAELQKTKYGATSRPLASAGVNPTSRDIAAAVQRAVWARDGGQCAFVGPEGRCTERGFLEFHHRVPYADGGGKTAAEIELRCRAHNQYEAERWFGTTEDYVLKEMRASYG